MAAQYGHVAPIRLALEGTAALASGRAVASGSDDGDGINPQLLRRKKTARFADELPNDGPLRLAEVTYDELVDLRNTALALALARDGDKKQNYLTFASQNKKQQPPSSMLPDPAQLRDLVLAAVAASDAATATTLSTRESIDRASLRIAREACWSEERKWKRKSAAAAAAAAEAAAKKAVADRRNRRRRDNNNAEPPRGGGASSAAPNSDDDDDNATEEKEDESDEGEETGTTVAAVQLAVKQVLVGEKRRRRQGSPATAALPVVVGLKEKKEQGASAAASTSSYFAASDDDCLLFSAAEELQMPFFSANARGAGGADESGQRQRRKAATLESRGQRLSAVAPAATVLAEALRLSLG